MQLSPRRLSPVRAVRAVLLLVLLLCTAEPYLAAASKQFSYTIAGFELRITNASASTSVRDTSWSLVVAPQTNVSRTAWSARVEPPVNSRPLLGAGTPTTFVSLGEGTFLAEESSGNFKFKQDIKMRTAWQSVTGVDTTGCDDTSGTCDSITVSGGLYQTPEAQPSATYNLTFSKDVSGEPAVASRGGLWFSLRIKPTSSIKAPTMFLTWDAAQSEQFFGLGEQYSIHGMRSRVVPVVTTEQGVGRGLEPLSAFLNVGSPLHNAAGDWHTSYTAIPHYVSSAGRSVYVNETRYLTFDFGATHSPSSVDLMVLADPDAADSGSELVTGGYIIHGDTPKDTIQQYTSYVGRMQPVPTWASSGGAVVGWEGGTNATLAFFDQLIAANVSVVGLWLQDWTGLRVDPFGKRLWWNWELDEDWYPGWEQLVAKLASNGARMTTYINPYLANTVSADKPNHRRDLWKEAAGLGYLIKNSSGLPYVQSSASKSFTFTAIDLTNEAAREWTKRLIRCNMFGDQKGCDGNATAIKGAQSGFMSDFGEYIPFDAVLSAGTGADLHSAYPELWTRTCREAAREAGLNDEVVFWSRSASARSPASASMFWAGDQLTTWDSYDGLKSALRGMLSGGLSGLAFTHSDIGGYTEVKEGPYKILRTPELLKRWTEMEAFSGTMFRTHPGLLPTKSAQVNSDAAALAHFAFFSRVHAALGPYRQLLITEAQATGHPVVRYMFLEYPDDPMSWILCDQFMFGSEFVVAPVFDSGATQVSLYLPAGTWRHIWSGRDTVVSADPSGSGKNITVPAQLGQPAAFLRVGREKTPISAAASAAQQLLQQMALHQ